MLKTIKHVLQNETFTDMPDFLSEAYICLNIQIRFSEIKNIIKQNSSNAPDQKYKLDIKMGAFYLTTQCGTIYSFLYLNIKQ